MSAEAETTTAAPARKQSRKRAAGVWVVLVIAGLLLLLSSFAVWINRVALNTSVFADTSSSLLDDPAIRTAVANRAVDELFANVDVQEEVQAQLPSGYKGLAGPATAGLRQASYQIVNRALEQPRFQTLFKATLEETHKTLVQVLHGGGDRVSTQNGEVVLDLRPIVAEAADRIGVGQQVASKLPQNAGRIVVLRSDQLKTAQNGFELLKTLAWVLPILTLLAFGLAVWLAHDRRRAVRGIGATLAAVGLIGLAAANLTRNYVVDSLVAQQNDRQAANNAWDILTELMRGSFRLLVVVGILFIVAAWLAGPGRRALATRGWLAPVIRVRLWAYIVLAILVLILLSTSGVSDFTRFLVVVLLAALGAAWIELTRRQTLAEFPDAGDSNLVADTRERLGSWWESRRAPTQVGAPAAGTDVTSRLSSLAALHASGALTDEEYASAKARVLAGE
jgi:Short C-terminal domain